MWYQSEFLQLDLMVDNNSSSNGHAHDDVRGMEVLKVSRLTQETALRALARSVDLRF